jgi:hypothetical protein
MLGAALSDEVCVTVKERKKEMLQLHLHCYFMTHESLE